MSYYIRTKIFGYYKGLVIEIYDTTININSRKLCSFKKYSLLH